MNSNPKNVYNCNLYVVWALKVVEPIDFLTFAKIFENCPHNNGIQPFSICIGR